jgi:hypothetical protein
LEKNNQIKLHQLKIVNNFQINTKYNTIKVSIKKMGSALGYGIEKPQYEIIKKNLYTSSGLNGLASLFFGKFVSKTSMTSTVSTEFEEIKKESNEMSTPAKNQVYKRRLYRI